MTQTHFSTAYHDEEVLRFWALQASQLQAAYEALWRHLESLPSLPSLEEQHELS